jgi:hypothetical protein
MDAAWWRRPTFRVIFTGVHRRFVRRSSITMGYASSLPIFCCSSAFPYPGCPETDRSLRYSAPHHAMRAECQEQSDSRHRRPTTLKCCPRSPNGQPRGRAAGRADDSKLHRLVVKTFPFVRSLVAHHHLRSGFAHVRPVARLQSADCCYQKPTGKGSGERGRVAVVDRSPATRLCLHSKPAFSRTNQSICMEATRG